jgi:precorrin-2/cobalt-factor-2 C20-methyltransferase
MAWGRFYGVGVGPGDPELLTLKAKRVLEEVDLLFCPHSRKGKRSLALSIVSGTVQRDWELVELILPMTKERRELTEYWHSAAREVIRFLAQGRSGAFITLGDPTLFSTFTYLMEEIKKEAPQIEFEIIPGISAVNYVSSRVQTALAEGEEKLLIVPGPYKEKELAAYMDEFENIVLMKAGSQLEKIASAAADRPQRFKTFLASRCGFPDEYISRDLSNADKPELDYLTTVMLKKIPGGDGQ